MQYQNMSGPRLRLPVVSKPRVPSPSQPSESATKKELANVPSNDENQPSDSVVVIKTENNEPVNTAGNNM
jgi:cytoskeletal protein RodZ